MSAGRPSLYSPDMCERIIEAGKQGMAVAEMASELGVAKSTLYLWAKEHPEFSDSFTSAQDEAEAWWARNLRGGLQKAPSEYQGPANLKYMAQRFKEWSEKSTQEHTGVDGKDLVLWGVRPEPKPE